MEYETVTVFDELTQEEKERMSLELARAVIEAQGMKETLAENSADMKSKIKIKEGLVTTISRTLSLGKIQREISISRKKDMEKGVMLTIDLRTDKEIPHLRRPLRPDELQEELELDPPPATESPNPTESPDGTKGNADGKLQPGRPDNDKNAGTANSPDGDRKGAVKKNRRKNS